MNGHPGDYMIYILQWEIGRYMKGLMEQGTYLHFCQN